MFFKKLLNVFGKTSICFFKQFRDQRKSLSTRIKHKIFKQYNNPKLFCYSSAGINHKMYPFPNAIHKYFSFLNDLGFSIIEKEEVNPNAMGNGYFIFTSSSTGLEIVLDRGQVLMKIGKTSQDRKEWIDWSIISSVYSPTEKAYDFDLDIDSQVKRLSELLIKHCQQLLKGDFNKESLHQVIQAKIGKAFLTRFLQE